MDPKVSDSWYDRNKGREKKVLQEAFQDNQHPGYHITVLLRQSCAAILNGLPWTRLPIDITFILYEYQWTMWFPLQSTYLDLYLFYKKRQYLCKQNHHQIPSSASNVMTISQGWFLTLTFPFQCIGPNTFSHFCKGSRFIPVAFLWLSAPQTQYGVQMPHHFMSLVFPCFEFQCWLHHWAQHVISDAHEITDKEFMWKL